MTEPATKITMLSWTRSFLLKRSASLPQIGVVAALASSAAVMTQAKSVWVPLSSDMMVGSALATMVLLRMAVKKAASRPVSASMIWRWVIATWGAGWRVWGGCRGRPGGGSVAGHRFTPQQRWSCRWVRPSLPGLNS